MRPRSVLSLLRPFVSVLGFAALLLLAFVPVGCRRAEPIAATDPVFVTGSPATVYAAVQPVLLKRIAANTQLLRSDQTDQLTLRFSVRTEPDNVIRLVEVSVRKSDETHAVVSVVSAAFSFTRTARRDASDRALEREVLGIFKTSKPQD